MKTVWDMTIAPASRPESRRRHERVAADRPVTVRAPSGIRVKARLVDISLGGVAIRFEAPADPGTRLELRFLLPVARNRLKELEVRGVVRHRRVQRDGFVMGLEFEDADVTLQNTIRRYISFRRSL